MVYRAKTRAGEERLSVSLSLFLTFVLPLATFAIAAACFVGGGRGERDALVRVLREECDREIDAGISLSDQRVAVVGRWADVLQRWLDRFVR